ncbi:MAG: type II secretion system protein [Planctomycetota bacterium]
MTTTPRPHPASGPRGDARGFTLLELVFAFAILALAIVGLMESQTKSMDKGVKTLELRDLRVMADTVFRRIVYESNKWEDGQRGDAADWYADFAQVPAGPQRDRWKQYRLELRKKKGLVAGTDPSGGLSALFEDAGTTSTSTSSGSTSGTGTGTGTGSSSSETDGATTGEPAYLLELNVYFQDREEPELVLRSIVPLSQDELDQFQKK